jgi:proline dehydrogenase
MEGSACTSPTIALFRLLRARADNVGLCLQANLRRTPSDLAELGPLASAIRLVKGAYAEPAERAFPRKRDVDAAYLALLDELLRLAADPATTGRWGLPAIATHDVRIVRRIAAAAEARGLPRTSFEVQMLYGIRTGEQELLRREGFRVRVLISYGEHWFPWYMRRLAERPANLWFVIRSTVAG